MSIKTSIIFKLIHNVLLWVSLIMVMPAVVLFVYEQNQPFEKYVKYFHVIPFSTAYDVGDDIQFNSFYESYEPVDIAWGETVWCESGNGFTLIDTASTSDQDFFVNRTYSPEIKSILVGIYQDKHIAPPEIEELLRQYAKKSTEEGFTEGSKIGAWRINIDKPKAGSSCYARHKIRVLTPYFKLEKQYELYSSPWKYGQAAH